MIDNHDIYGWWWWLDSGSVGQKTVTVQEDDGSPRKVGLLDQNGDPLVIRRERIGFVHFREDQ